MTDAAVLGPTQDMFMFWRADGSDRPNCALYAGRVYLGEVRYVEGQPRKPGSIWSAWLNTTDMGNEVGRFQTEEEAKNALMALALTELFRG